MAIETREVEVLTCDGCGATTVLLPEGPDIPNGWYTGSVILHHEGGGSGGDWAACKSAHIKSAVADVVSRNY